MKKIPLLPRYFRWVGLILMLLSISARYLESLRFYTFAFLSREGNFRFINVDMSLTAFIFCLTLGLLIISFTKKKIEDEMIQSARLFSWSWSIISSFLIFLLTTLFVYDSNYLIVFYFPQLILIIFILVFNIQLYSFNKGKVNEE